MTMKMPLSEDPGTVVGVTVQINIFFTTLWAFLTPLGWSCTSKRIEGNHKIGWLSYSAYFLSSPVLILFYLFGSM